MGQFWLAEADAMQKEDPDLRQAIQFILRTPVDMKCPRLLRVSCTPRWQFSPNRSVQSLALQRRLWERGEQNGATRGLDSHWHPQMVDRHLALTISACGSLLCRGWTPCADNCLWRHSWRANDEKVRFNEALRALALRFL